MLKVDCTYRIYGMGFENTVKSLMNEGFIDGFDSHRLKTHYILENDIDDFDDDKDDFASLQKYITSQAEDFVVTVCKKARYGPVPIGFIYI